MADSRNNSVDIRNVQFCGSEIEFDQVLDGDLIGSTNYLFSEIGKPVPIQPKLSFIVHDSLPVQPLVVSHRFHLLFVAHADGFYVARTEEVITSAEKMKNDGSGPSIQELSIANVHVGKVSILALSAGDSLLAASVANELHFFPVSSLLHKEQKPSYSILLEDSSCIKDMKWASTENKAYVILSSNRKLYHGYGQGSPVDVMDNVDSGNSVYEALSLCDQTLHDLCMNAKLVAFEALKEFANIFWHLTVLLFLNTHIIHIH